MNIRVFNSIDYYKESELCEQITYDEFVQLLIPIIEQKYS